MKHHQSDPEGDSTVEPHEGPLEDLWVDHGGEG